MSEFSFGGLVCLRVMFVFVVFGWVVASWRGLFVVFVVSCRCVLCHDVALSSWIVMSCHVVYCWDSKQAIKAIKVAL